MEQKQLFTSEAEKSLAENISRLAFCNPFLPERVELEKAVLGKRFQEKGTVWSAGSQTAGDTANLKALTLQVEAFVETLRKRLQAGTKAAKADLELYEDLVSYLIYYRYEAAFQRFVLGSRDGGKFGFFHEFCDAVNFFLKDLPGKYQLGKQGLAHLFACFFQVRRAFHSIFHFIIGPSLAAARLRAGVWQSIFTCDMRLYRRSLYARLGDVSVLISGPSGTGKELVARAIGYARYIPFNPEKLTFAEGWNKTFHALNLTALSANLIESELFGHRKGAYTGALEDHAGWLENCGEFGTVFLDEIGEISGELQVKLLRVLEARTFSRLGETTTREFSGKLIAATNRQLEKEMNGGKFRPDLYYRLCSDILETPSLQQRVADCPEELDILVRFLARRIAGEEEAATLARTVLTWIDTHLGTAYPWPGNVRELEQCVRNIMIRGSYRPVCTSKATGIWERAQSGLLTADELLAHYCKLVFDREGTYEGAGKALGLDRRTVKSRIDSLANTNNLSAR